MLIGLENYRCSNMTDEFQKKNMADELKIETNNYFLRK